MYAFLTSRLDDMCVPPDIFTSEPEIMVPLKYRLGKMDKLCQMTLESLKLCYQNWNQRRLVKGKVLMNSTRYKALTEIEYPDAMDTISDEFTGGILEA